MGRGRNEAGDSTRAAWRRHERRWKENRYVYAVVSRRSRGVSIGLNLNPDRRCNFDCVYCQVDRTEPPPVRRVSLEALSEELDQILQAERDGSLYEDLPFRALAREERGIRDIAFSGDGEPTTFRRLEGAVRVAAAARRRFGLDAAALVLITNASCLGRPPVRAALAALHDCGGQVWAKLDAGTEEYFRAINRTRIRFARVLDNILSAARAHPLVIQSLWAGIGGGAPADAEIEAYCGRLSALIAGGAQIRGIQIYTVARTPAEACVSPLPDAALDHIRSLVESRAGPPVSVYYSP